MRIASTSGRLCLAIGERALDVERASEGRFGSASQAIYARWGEFRQWASERDSSQDLAWIGNIDDLTFDAPVPSPSQVFAIGLNYKEHAEEGGLDSGEQPMVFTKFPSSITGPTGDIGLPDGFVDFEAELVVVIGVQAHHISREQAWDHVAGLTVGQDLSERQLQIAPPLPPQFSLGKSFPKFGPTGPWVVTPDDLAAPDDLEITCSLNGEQMQFARTSQMIFGVPDIVAYLSSVVTLMPGDLIFTGTPAGVGFVRDPKRQIQPGDELVTTIEHLGVMRHRFIAPTGP